jgi:hypothetical protein
MVGARPHPACSKHNGWGLLNSVAGPQLADTAEPPSEASSACLVSMLAEPQFSHTHSALPSLSKTMRAWRPPPSHEYVPFASTATCALLSKSNSSHERMLPLQLPSQRLGSRAPARPRSARSAVAPPRKSPHPPPTRAAPAAPAAGSREAIYRPRHPPLPHIRTARNSGHTTLCARTRSGQSGVQTIFALA